MTEPKDLPANYALMYTSKKAKASHLVHPDQRTVLGYGMRAICGMYDIPMGTGSWAELEHAASLPICKSCLKVAPKEVLEVLDG